MRESWMGRKREWKLGAGTEGEGATNPGRRFPDWNERMENGKHEES
jgi:hypothetical protein